MMIYFGRIVAIAKSWSRGLFVAGDAAALVLPYLQGFGQTAGECDAVVVAVRRISSHEEATSPPKSE
jgi:hypothetical protein